MERRQRQILHQRNEALRRRAAATPAPPDDTELRVHRYEGENATGYDGHESAPAPPTHRHELCESPTDGSNEGSSDFSATFPPDECALQAAGGAMNEDSSKVSQPRVLSSARSKKEGTGADTASSRSWGEVPPWTARQRKRSLKKRSPVLNRDADPVDRPDDSRPPWNQQLRRRGQLYVTRCSITWPSVSSYSSKLLSLNRAVKTAWYRDLCCSESRWLSPVILADSVVGECDSSVAECELA